MEKTPGKRAINRLWPVDALRGLALLNMLVYHGMYDWVYVFGHQSSWYDIWSTHCHIWQQYICWSFILLSGFSVAFSRKAWKNGVIIGGCALILTAVTILVLPSERILFGVLHFMACALLITAAVRPLLDHCPAGPGLACSAVLFFLTRELPNGWLGFEALLLKRMPDSLYAGNWFWLGFPDLTRFYSADYFSILPWIFLFWCGFFLHRLLHPRLAGMAALHGKPPAALRPLCGIGANTLAIYMAHQVVLYGGLWVLDAVLH